MARATGPTGLLQLGWADRVDRPDVRRLVPPGDPRVCLLCASNYATGLNPYNTAGWPEPTCNWCQAWVEADIPDDQAVVARWIRKQRAACGRW